jgi:NhaP-type Na+/H+ or K+/H+ antiporter
MLFAEEMGGGALLGVGGGYVLLLVLRRLDADKALYPVVALLGALLLFGATQSVGASGFIAVYLAGITVGTTEHQSRPAVESHFESMSWLAQIVLFLVLGLLITPHMILSAPWFVLAATTATLLLVATGRRNVLIVTGSAAEEVAEFIILSAKSVCRLMLLETAHTSDASFDSAMVLFKSIVQVDARPVADVAAQR